MLKVVYNVKNMDNFEFDEKRHLYRLNGKPITGVTTILSVLNSPWLMSWSANMVVEYIKKFGKPSQKRDSNHIDSYIVTTDQLELARTYHQTITRSAGDIGKRVHKWIEEWVRAQIDESPYVFPLPEPDLKHITDNFVRWVKENNVKFIASEKKLYSKKHWYAGTMDIAMEIGNKVWIGDIKTGGGISPRMFFQTAAYQQALQETEDFPKIEGNIIINVKKDGTMNVEKSYGFDTNFKGFLACLQIYHSLKELQIGLNATN
jgi:hypothetical protein